MQIFSYPDCTVRFHCHPRSDTKQKKICTVQHWALSFLTLITTFRVVRWPCCWAAIIQRTKKDPRRKVNKYQQMCPFYSSQYIVCSLTARHTGEVYCVLSVVIPGSERLLLTGRTTATGRTTSGGWSHIMAANFADYRFGALDEKRVGY